MDDSGRALIVIPTYNEAENLEPLVRAITALAMQADILVVDDNSPDGTGLIADRLAQELEHVHVLHRSSKQGLGPAYIAGFSWALERDYAYVFEMDCDFSHHPRYLPTFLERIRDADLVIGSRYVRHGGTANWGLVRKLISAGGNLFARTMLGLGTRGLAVRMPRTSQNFGLSSSMRVSQSLSRPSQRSLSWLLVMMRLSAADSDSSFCA